MLVTNRARSPGYRGGARPGGLIREGGQPRLVTPITRYGTKEGQGWHTPPPKGPKALCMKAVWGEEKDQNVKHVPGTKRDVPQLGARLCSGCLS
jgi:hypothetical protein